MSTYDIYIYDEAADGLVRVDARTLTAQQMRAQLADAPDREEGDFWRRLLGMPPARVAQGECMSAEDAVGDVMAETGCTREDAVTAIDSLIAAGLDADAWWDDAAGTQYISLADVQVAACPVRQAVAE